MWEKYKEKDSRIIRPMDGYESVLISMYLNIIDVFPEFSIEDFRKNAQENLSNIEFFNIGIKLIDKHPFWIRKPFKMNLKEIEWTEDEEIDVILKKEHEIITPLQKVYDEKDKDIIIPFLFEICQLKDKKIKLKFSVIHAMSDGRTIFYMFDLLKKIIKGEKLEKMETPICSFNQRGNFHDLNPSIYEETPKTWKEINELSVLPKDKYRFSPHSKGWPLTAFNFIFPLPFNTSSRNIPPFDLYLSLFLILMASDSSSL